MADKDQKPETPEAKNLRLAKKIKALEDRIDFYDFLYREGRHKGPVPQKSVARAYWRYAIAWSTYTITKIIYPDSPIHTEDPHRDMRRRWENYQRIKAKAQGSPK